MDFIDTGVWKPINSLPGYECCIEYHVNSQGDVKSTKGQIERILKPRLHSSGYKTVNLTQRIGRKQAVTAYIHVLVALAFLSAPITPHGKTKGCSIVRHINGDRGDCSVSNLEWSKRSLS